MQFSGQWAGFGYPEMVGQVGTIVDVERGYYSVHVSGDSGIYIGRPETFTPKSVVQAPTN